MVKLIYGKAINDSSTPIKRTKELEKLNGKRVQEVTWECPIYIVWHDMIRRCLSESFKQKHRTYEDVTVCDEWLKFSKFRGWVNSQDWNGKQLDKDILGDGKLYSPDTCCFVTNKINCFILDNLKQRGKYKIGVSWHKKDMKFRAYIKDLNARKYKHLGNFNTESEAHLAWAKQKYEYAIYLANSQDDVRVRMALISRYANILKEAENACCSVY